MRCICFYVYHLFQCTDYTMSDPSRNWLNRLLESKRHICPICKEGVILYRGYKCHHDGCGVKCVKYPDRKEFWCNNAKCYYHGAISV